MSGVVLPGTIIVFDVATVCKDAIIVHHQTFRTDVKAKPRRVSVNRILNELVRQRREAGQVAEGLTQDSQVINRSTVGATRSRGELAHDITSRCQWPVEA